MLKKVLKYITQHQLPTPPAPILVALSGGADSVALLLALKNLGYALTAAHCNFHLRGPESDRDEDFVRQLCATQKIPLRVKHFETGKVAAEQGISIEMAARELRYGWFEEVRQDINATAIAVAHHADDNAETLLLNLVRGTGLRGLKGMLPKNGHIIRPLLDLHHKELESYLQSMGQDYVTDSTNAETVYKRNKIRHEVLPLLRQLNPAIDESLSQTAQRLAETAQLYDYALEQLHQEVCEKLSDGIRIDLGRLDRQPAPATLLHEFLSPFGFTPATIAQIASMPSETTGKLYTATEYMAVFHRGTLEVRKRPTPMAATPLPLSGILHLEAGKFLHIECLSREDLGSIPKASNKAALDANRITGSLWIRSCQTCDRFHPFGMKGSKLVSDYLTDRHRSLIDKMAAWVVGDDQGIVWLVNERLDQRAAISDTTREVILLTLD